jgi:predicted alpha/beta superfamily hydrolase
MPAKKSKGRKRIIGKARYHKKFYSRFLDNERDIIVWLPPSYNNKNDKRYPVLYMHDGQNIMDPLTSFAGMDWQVDETVTRLINEKKIQEIIVVGIYNTPERVGEYSDSEKGNKYIQFIIYELKPFIDKSYKTFTDAKNNAVVGSSMGGLISFLINWKYEDIFFKSGCLSSSFYYDNEKAIRMVKEYDGPKKEVKIYIDHGEDGLTTGQKMFSALTEKGYIIGRDIDYYYAPGAEHREDAWAERLERPLVFLFGKKK